MSRQDRLRNRKDMPSASTMFAVAAFIAVDTASIEQAVALLSPLLQGCDQVVRRCLVLGIGRTGMH